MSKEEYQATVRIDITPEMLEQLQQVPAPARVPGSLPNLPPVKAPAGTPVIRVANKPVDSAELGGPAFQELLQSIYDAVFIVEPSGKIFSSNARAEHYFNADRKKLRSSSVLEWMCGADQSLLDTILSTLENNRFVLIQAICQRADNTVFPAEISVNRLPLGAKLYLSFFIRDITVRKESEERLKTGYNALANSGSGVLVVDIDGNMVGYVNPAAITLLGLETAEEAPDYIIRQFIIDDVVANEIERTIRQEESWTGELEMKRRDGGSFFAQASFRPNLNPDGAVTGVVISLLDVTPQRMAQRQLELYAQQLRAKNREMEADLSLARELQLAFLPSAYPTITGKLTGNKPLEFAHVYHPSGLVGGDFFSILPVSPSKALVFIADVMGHGARAALVVATIRGLLEQIARETSDTGLFMTRLNSAYSEVFANADDLMFATAACASIDIDTGEIQFTDAGHPFPLIIRGDGTVSASELPDDACGPALGLFPKVVYSRVTSKIGSGDRIIFYTDGLSETRNTSGDEFDEPGMLASIQKRSRERLQAILDGLIIDVTEFSGTSIFEDDVCILGVGCPQSEPPTT